MTSLEKAARAILKDLPNFVGDSDPGKPDYIVSYIDCGEVDLRDLARAVLMAVRDGVTEAMIDAGHLHDPLGCDVEYAAEIYPPVFTAMIDAILAENPK